MPSETYAEYTNTKYYYQQVEWQKLRNLRALTRQIEEQFDEDVKRLVLRQVADCTDSITRAIVDVLQNKHTNTSNALRTACYFNIRIVLNKLLLYAN